MINHKNLLNNYNKIGNTIKIKENANNHITTGVTMVRIPKSFHTGLCLGNAPEVQRITTQTRVGTTVETGTIGTTGTMMMMMMMGTQEGASIKGRGIPTNLLENLPKVVQEGTSTATEKRETTIQKNLAHEAL